MADVVEYFGDVFVSAGSRLVVIQLTDNLGRVKSGDVFWCRGPITGLVFVEFMKDATATAGDISFSFPDLTDGNNKVRAQEPRVAS